MALLTFKNSVNSVLPWWIWNFPGLNSEHTGNRSPSTMFCSGLDTGMALLTFKNSVNSVLPWWKEKPHLATGLSSVLAAPIRPWRRWWPGWTAPGTRWTRSPSTQPTPDRCFRPPPELPLGWHPPLSVQAYAPQLHAAQRPCQRKVLSRTGRAPCKSSIVSHLG